MYGDDEVESIDINWHYDDSWLGSYRIKIGYGSGRTERVTVVHERRENDKAEPCAACYDPEDGFGTDAIEFTEHTFSFYATKMTTQLLLIVSILLGIPEIREADGLDRLQHREDYHLIDVSD